VFYDLTSTYFEGRGPPEIGAHGHSRDGKPRNPQLNAHQKLSAITAADLLIGWGPPQKRFRRGISTKAHDKPMCGAKIKELAR